MNNSLKIFFSWALTILLLLSSGCSSIMPGEEEELVPIKTIGVLPAQPSHILQSEDATASEIEKGIETLNLLLTDYFSGYQNVDLIDQSQLEGLSSADQGRPFYLAREAGEQLNHDAVLITLVKRFQARDGSELAVIRPASVAFSFRLLEVKKGQIIWSADFDQTQQPLFENILPKSRSTGAGFRWLSAEELAAAGLDKKLKSSPYLERN
jgi:hypothetical protein